MCFFWELIWGRVVWVMCVSPLAVRGPSHWFLLELIWGRVVLTNTCFFLSGRGSLWNLSVLEVRPVANVAGALALEHIVQVHAFGTRWNP